jgi:hypothetical protein
VGPYVLAALLGLAVIESVTRSAAITIRYRKSVMENLSLR